jgi:hypothetical protein
MIDAVVQKLRSSWSDLLLTDILFKVVAFILLTPLVSLVFRAFLAVSGRTVLADVDIAKFLFHPIGWVTLIVVGGSSVGLLAIEQSALMTISPASTHQRKLGIPAILRFIAWKTPGILRIASGMVARTLILAAWTVNDRVAMSLMISRGADNLITDHPALARQVIAERAEMSPIERILVELAFVFGTFPPPASSPEQ